VSVTENQTTPHDDAPDAVGGRTENAAEDHPMLQDTDPNVATVRAALADGTANSFKKSLNTCLIIWTVGRVTLAATTHMDSGNLDRSARPCDPPLLACALRSGAPSALDRSMCFSSLAAQKGAQRALRLCRAAGEPQSSASLRVRARQQAPARSAYAQRLYGWFGWFRTTPRRGGCRSGSSG
jgi:hypothetical protein